MAFLVAFNHQPMLSANTQQPTYSNGIYFFWKYDCCLAWTDWEENIIIHQPTTNNNAQPSIQSRMSSIGIEI